MLKPFLKRSQPLNIDKSGEDQQRIIPQQTRTYTSVAPSIFVTDYWSNFFKQKKTCWSILNNETISIPSLNSMMLNEQTKVSIQSRYIWSIQQTLLVIWHYQMGGKITIPNKFLFDAEITAVHIKEMNWNSLNANITVVAISFNNTIHLFQLKGDKLHALQIIISISAAKASSLVLISPEDNKVQRNSLIFVDNQGYLGVYDLVMNRKMQTKSLSKKILNQFINTNNGSQVLDIKSYGDKIFSLVKVASSQKMSAFMRIMGIGMNHQEIILKVYSYNEKGLKHRTDISSQILLQKLKESFQDFFTEKTSDLSFQIQAINPCQEHLQIIFQCGYMINVQDTTNVTFTGTLYSLPNKPIKIGMGVIGQNGQSMVKKVKMANWNVWIFQDKEVVTRFNNKYSYALLQENQQPIQITKLPQKKINPKYRSINRWAILLKKSVKISTSLHQTDILLIISYIYCQLVRMHELTQDIHDRINNKLKILMDSWGTSQTIVSIIQLLSWGRQYYIQFQNQIYQNLKSELKDLNTLKQENITKTIYISADIEEYLWNLMFAFHNKRIITQSLQTDSSDVLWNALMIITTEIISHIRDKTPIFFMQNQLLIMEVTHRIQCFIQIVQKIKINYFQKYSKEQEQQGNLTTNKDWENSLKQDKQFSRSTTSTIKLIQTLMLTLPKIKTLIIIYQTLGQYKFNISYVPTIENVIENRQARIDLGKLLVQSFQNNNDMVLDRIEEDLPDLELKTIRIQRLWNVESDVFFERIKDLSEEGAKQVITCLLNLNNLKKIRQFYAKGGKQALFMQILGQKIMALNRQMFKIDKLQRQILAGDVIDRIDKIGLEKEKENIEIEKKEYIEVLKSSNYQNRFQKINEMTSYSSNNRDDFSNRKGNLINSKPSEDKFQSILKNKYIQQIISSSKNKKNSQYSKYD